MGRYPWAEILLFEVLHVIVFYPTRQRVYRTVILSIMVLVAARIFSTPEVTDPLSVTYTIGCTVAYHFVFTAYLLFAEGPFPDHWRRVRDGVHAKADSDGPDILPSNFPLAKKLWWMIDIAYSLRMIGWVSEPRKYLPPPPPPSRHKFLRRTFLKLIINSIIADVTSSVFSSSPAFNSRFHDPTDGPETYLAAVPLLHRIPYILVYALMQPAGMNVIHYVVALVCVGLGNSSPTLWPDITGCWEDAYTVGRLWGLTWHQRMRPAYVGLGRLVANNLLKFPRGTIWSFCTQLYLAFFLTGLIHFAGDIMVQQKLVYYSFKFFLLQAVAITFENFVIYITKRSLRRMGVELEAENVDGTWGGVVLRVIGYCWVTLWFCLTFPLWLDELNVKGFGNVNRAPITQFVLDTWKERTWGT